MIKISKIKPLGSSDYITIASISGNYLSRIKKDYNPLTFISQSIANNNLRSKDEIELAILTPEQATCLIYIRDHFDSIITGTPLELADHITAIDNSVFGEEIDTHFGKKFKLNLFGKGVYKIFGYEDFFRKKGRKGIWLATQLNIKTCPYCNGQYTLTINKDSKSFRAKFQFDHFFSKKRFPYLSLSLYNLIPCCAPCNLSKGDILTNLATYYHPYHNNLSYRSFFKVKYPIETRKLSIGKINALDLKVIYRPKYSQFNGLIEEHNRIYEIESSYNRHTDIVEDLLCKAIINNNSFKKDIMKIKGLFDGDDKLYKRYLIGNYAFEDEILERPLAKFTQDISKQFEII